MSTWEYHVEPHSGGGWQVRRGDREIPVAFYNKFDAAISAARVLARINVSGVFVHGNGKVAKTDHRGQEIRPEVLKKIRMKS